MANSSILNGCFLLISILEKKVAKKDESSSEESSSEEEEKPKAKPGIVNFRFSSLFEIVAIIVQIC